jgi:NADPH:quinone reductase-like Zn-dependent oxidoreductase
LDAWALVPPELDLTDSASLPVVALTGAQLIEEAVRPGRNDLLLVTGGTGKVLLTCDESLQGEPS